ncbi:MAG TPA: hypothetical protein VM370_12490 [Candidatus Thermoplasmatota archaeon]|nr:hypothetical protein [Candidatus Thermoplasmatota archaeon]
MSEDEMVTFRLGPRDRAAIQRLVDAGEFRNRSDFLRYAVKATITTYDATKADTKKLDLDIPQVDLPSHSPARKTARGRSTKGVNL